MDEETESCILLCGQLYFHCSELHSPSNTVIDGYFEPYWVPVCAVEHLEYRVGLFSHYFKLFVSYQHIPFENVGHVIEQVRIDFCFGCFGLLCYILFYLFRDVHWEIIVLGTVEFSRPNVQTGKGVSRCRKIFWTFWVSLFGIPAVYARGQYIPSSVPVWNFALVERSTRSDGQHERTQYVHLVVNISSMV